jgi:hypothetical protein
MVAIEVGPDGPLPVACDWFLARRVLLCDEAHSRAVS